MRILLVSKFGDSIALAEKLREENNDVSIYIRDNIARRLTSYSYMIDNPTVDTINSDLILVEDDNSGAFSDKARELGRPICGGGIAADKLIRQRSFLESVVESAKLRMAKKDTKGIPVNLGGWFVGEEFLRPYFLGIRYPRIGTGDVGKPTRGMGIVGQYRMKGHIFQVLKKLEPFLKTVKYSGYVNINLLVNNDNPLVSDIELGLTYPNVAPLCELHNNISKFLFKVATNTTKQLTAPVDKIVLGVSWLSSISELIKQPMYCKTGSSIEEAVSKVYKEMHKIDNKDVYYRVDIGVGYNTYLKELHKWELI